MGAGQQDNNKKTLGHNREKGVTGVWNLNNEIASENNNFQQLGLYYNWNPAKSPLSLFK